MTRPRTLGIVARYPYGFFFNAVLFGAKAVACQHDTKLLVVQGSPESVAASQIARNQVDAWIVLSHLDGIKQLIAQGKPVITVSTVASDLACPAVVPDNRGGVEAAMLHLFEHGHERIGFVGWTELGDIAERYEGYRAALAKRGLPFDDSWLVVSEGPQVEDGQRAAQQLIATGIPCTAIIVGNDMNALGLMEALQTAGYRIPEDIAVVGFDDIPDAQSATPPLSTVRQRFDALGANAVRVLLGALDGQPADVPITHTPVTFVQRQSCGCQSALSSDALHAPERYAGADWGDQLARALVDLLLHPIVVPADTTPAQIWPEVANLVGAVADTLDSVSEPDFTALQSAWNSDLVLRANVEALHAAIALIEQVVALRSGSDGPRTVARNVLGQIHLAAMRSSRNYEEVRIRYLERVVANTHRISLLLLDENNPEAQQLNWLGSTGIAWGCLGRWGSLVRDPHTDLIVEQSYSRVADAGAPVGQRYTVANFPPLELLERDRSQTDLSTSLVLPLQTANHEWGFLALAGTIVPLELRFAESATDNLVMWAAQLVAMLERRELGISLRQSYENERILAGTVRELGAPVIPLIQGVLLIPLVGALDSARAQQVISAVLGGVTQHHATVVLLDLTAVPIVDTQVANTLIQAAQSATLLGAQVILVGIRPEIAQSIVSLGIDLRQIISQPTLEVALQSLLAERKLSAG